MDDTEKLIYSELKALRLELRNGFEKMNGRVRNIERWKWRIQGGMVFVSVIVVPLVIKVFFWET